MRVLVAAAETGLCSERDRSFGQAAIEGAEAEGQAFLNSVRNDAMIVMVQVAWAFLPPHSSTPTAGPADLVSDQWHGNPAPALAIIS